MSKAILIPIKPIWCAKIMNRDKLIEVRKNKALYKATMKLIEEQGYATFFMYCSKDNKHKLDYWETIEGWDGYYSADENGSYYFNGKVVAKFTVRKVEKIQQYENEHYCDTYYRTTTLTQNELLSKSSLTPYELSLYLNDKDGYAYHIEDLVIFDKPKELSEFRKIGFSEWCAEHPPILSLIQPKKCYEELKQFMITKAPQNYCYVESEE